MGSSIPQQHPRVDARRLEQRLVQLTRTPSVTGREDACVQLIERWLADSGAEVESWHGDLERIRRDPRYPGQEVERSSLPVVGAIARGRRPGPTVLLTGHVDVVPVTNVERWSEEPFSGRVYDDRVFGRGSCDMKSGLVAALEAFLAIVEDGDDFPGRVAFLAVPAEEDSGIGTLAAIRDDWTADVAIIPEPTSRPGPMGDVPELVIAQAGAMTVTVEVPGKPTHASKRPHGECAFEHFLPIHRAIRDDEARKNEHPEHPLMTALELPYANTVGKIRGGRWSSMVMDSLTAEVRVGVPVGQTTDGAFRRFAQRIAEVATTDPWLRDHPPVVRCKAAGFGSSFTPREHPLVRTMLQASEAEFRAPASVVGAPYGCDMSGWVRHARIPTVLYGPGQVELAHAVDESVSLSPTVASSRVLLRAVSNLLQLDVGELRAVNEAVYPPGSQAIEPRAAQK